MCAYTIYEHVYLFAYVYASLRIRSIFRMFLISLLYLLGSELVASPPHFSSVASEARQQAQCPSGDQPAPFSSRLLCSRLSLLEEWRGVRDDALSQLSGIKDCIFVHASGFIGGNKTQQGVLEMARRTLQAAARSPANGDS